jgi:rod shape-determining protein MreD
MPSLSIAGIIPNLFLGWMVFEVWRKPVNVILPIIFVLGICYDLTMPTMLGLHTLIFVLLTVGIDEFRRPLEKDSYITMAITVGLVALVYSLYIFLVYGIQAGFTLMLFLSFLGMFFYNLIITTLLVAVFLFISHLRLDFRHG